MCSLSQLELEIMKLSNSVERIHSFGKDRAIFNWGDARLLTRNVGEMIDIIAIFMNALAAAVTALQNEQQLITKAGTVEK